VRLLDRDAGQDRRPRLAGQPAADRQQRDHRQRQGDPEDQCEHEQPGQLADDDAERGEHRGAGAANTRAGDVDPREIGEHRRRQRPARDDGDGTGDGKRRHPRAGERDGGGHRADTDRDRRDRPDDQGDAQQRTVEAHAVRGEARGRSAGIDPQLAHPRFAHERADDAAGEERVEEQREHGAGERGGGNHAAGERRRAQHLDQRRDVRRAEQAGAVDRVAERAGPPRPRRRDHDDRDDRHDGPRGHHCEGSPRPQPRGSLTDRSDAGHAHS